MLECPNCHAEMKGEERFCPNCGARVDQTTRPAVAPAAPTAAPRTVVLPAAADVDRPSHSSEPLAPTTRLPAAELMPTMHFPEAQPAARPVPDVTIGTGMPAAAAPTPSSTQAATGATIIGGAPMLPQNPPPGAPSGPPYVIVSPGQPATSNGRRLWLIVALIAGLGLLAVVALIVGVALVVGSSPVAARPTAATVRTAQPAAGNVTAAPAATVLGGDQGFLLLEENFDNPGKNGFTAEKTDSAVYAIVDS